MKKIKIIYLPGHGGNFLAALFSLDPVSKPLLPINNGTQDTPMSRVNLYIDFLKQKKSPHFALAGHLVYEQSYEYCIQSVHPEEFNFDKDIHRLFQIHLDWSNFSNYWLAQSKINMDFQLARLRPGETQKNLEITKLYQPNTISINRFLNLQSWTQEYLRINELIGLQPHLVAAEILYKFWYELRVRDIIDNFDSLESHQLYKYYLERLREETAGTKTQWQVFYERVKDPQWPDCDEEKDFLKLPRWIQQELITKFGYQPQKQF
jgi:hypothetical protein